MKDRNVHTSQHQEIKSRIATNSKLLTVCSIHAMCIIVKRQETNQLPGLKFLSITLPIILNYDIKIFY